MRFKLRQNHLLIVSAAYILYLGMQGQLNLYIHPRYIAFTVIMSIIALWLLMNNDKSNEPVASKNDHGSHSLAKAVPIVLVLSVALVLTL